jgi:hypothetical protein
MKRRILKAIGIASLGIIGAGYFGQIWVSGQGNEPALVGSWDAQVTARDCETGSPIPFVPVFPALITYDLGGTMQETDLGAPGMVRLQGHGVWQRKPGGQYSAAFRYLKFAPDRTYLGVNVIRSSISMSRGGNEYSSTDTLEIFDADGNMIGTGCATQTATRFE